MSYTDRQLSENDRLLILLFTVIIYSVSLTISLYTSLIYLSSFLRKCDKIGSDRQLSENDRLLILLFTVIIYSVSLTISLYTSLIYLSSFLRKCDKIGYVRLIYTVSEFFSQRYRPQIYSVPTRIFPSFKTFQNKRRSAGSCQSFSSV